MTPIDKLLPELPPEPPHAAQAIQHGMNIARKIIWKHMAPGARARYYLKKTLQSLAQKV